jgi:hypothetical protein
MKITLHPITLPPHHPPETMSQMRYWIARLKPIVHPSIGLSMLCIGVTGAFVWTGWQYPEIFSFASSEPNAEDAENDAIGADIDSLAFLTQSTRSAPLAANSAQNPADPNNPTKADAAKPGGPTQSSLLSSNSFPILGGGPINLLSSTGNSTGNSVAGNGLNTSIGFQMDPPLQPSRPATTWTQFPQTPIEGTTAVPNDRLSNLQNPGVQNNGLPSNGFQTNGFQTNGFQTNGLPVNNWNNPAQGTTGLPTNTPSTSPNAYTSLTNPGLPNSGLPIDSGVAAPAGYAAPIAPIPQINSAPITPTVLPGADLPVQPLQPEQVFTAPRPLPGRVIGGGNINTFSNP